MRSGLHPARLTFSLILSLFSVIGILTAAYSAVAQRQPVRHLTATGGGYAEITAGFSAAAIANARNGQVNILVLPVAAASNPESITDDEREALTRRAEERRVQIEEACRRAAADRAQCTAILAPIFTRDQALDPGNVRYFVIDLSAIFLLDGDPTVAMRVLAGTPLESELARAYTNGVVVAGTGAGSNLLSAMMLSGYRKDFDARTALDFGAAEVWYRGQQRGLSFGVKSALFETRAHQDNRLGRLLNAIALPGAPHVGVGVDADTGLNIYDETRLQEVFGQYAVTIFDAETYQAANGVQYRGEYDTLSLRNVLLHMLAPGRVTYDLDTRAASLAAPRPRLERNFNALALPRNAGPLILAGDLGGSLSRDNAILDRLVDLSGGVRAKILIVATGYPSDSAAEADARRYAEAIGIRTQIVVVPSRGEVAPIEIADDVTGLALIARDPSRARLSALASIKAKWQSGLPLLADDAGAAIAGRFYAAQPPTPKEPDEAAIAVQQAFIQAVTPISAGLNLLNVLVEPQLLTDNRWGRWVALTYNHPDLPAFGLNSDTALEITADGARVIGRSVVLALDLRTSQRALGSNDAFIIANALLDVFAPGDALQPQPADVAAQVTRVPTPAMPTVTPTPTVTPQPTPTPTSIPPTPRPTATPTATPTVVPEPEPVPITGTPAFAVTVGTGVFILLVLLFTARRPMPRD